MRDIFNIRYVKLHFTLSIPNACEMPASKASAIRGGLGEMMLRANCISDRKCEQCSFESECMVQRTMYSKFERKPDFITNGDSVGYVIECEDYREHYEAGDVLCFNLILFGKTIVYFNTYLQALAALGQAGLGREHARFVITRITNTDGLDILRGNNIIMANYRVKTVRDYVAERMQQIAVRGLPNRIIVHTPVTIKYQGEFLQSFDMDAVVKAAQRRVHILDYFENCEDENFYREELPVPELIHQVIRPVAVRRFSTRQEQAMWLKGIKGNITIDELKMPTLEILLACEILHIGKNTSFGFGRITLD